MKIQEYIRLQIKGTPAADIVYYRPYFQNMNCKWCFYKGYGCKHPKTEGVCIDYRVEKRDLEFKPVGEHEKEV